MEKLKSRRFQSMLSHFLRKAIGETFESQLAEFSFRHVANIEHMPDCVIKYQNETTGINVRYEWKSQMSINLVKLERTASEVTEGRKIRSSSSNADSPTGKRCKQILRR